VGDGERIDADLIAAWMRASAARLAAEADHLTQLDSAIGDGDHGLNMQRGFGLLGAELEGGERPRAAGPLLIFCGRTLLAKVGGASGPLWGSFLQAGGRRLGEREAVGPEEFGEGLEAGLEAVRNLGAAQAGDKTMVDALAPAVQRLREGPFADLPVLFRAAAEAARLGAHDTIRMQARKGRASYLGERSVGHEDPGAASVAIVIDSLATTVG
jgi:phosphoenolpyruvate---glycerone phosphotransferase subunit DhaL